jgi:hypothetical protein
MIVAITFITCPGTNFTVEQLSVSRRASGGFAALTAEIIPLMWARPNTVKRPDRAAGHITRTHRGRSMHFKDAPAFPPVQRVGIITSPPILGGLHHHYVRV